MSNANLGASSKLSIVRRMVKKQIRAQSAVRLAGYQAIPQTSSQGYEGRSAQAARSKKAASKDTAKHSEASYAYRTHHMDIKPNETMKSR